jgi:outer membrane protein assembly factor BamE (lipoprotein component of BamABCDE complex)
MEIDLKSQDFKGSRHFAAVVLVIAGAATLTACTGVGETLTPRETFTQGYVIDPKAIELVPTGSSREQVLLALGTPSTTATFDNEVFYYVSQKAVRNAAFMKPHVVDRQVLAVYFGDDGRVRQIAHYGLKDGRIFDFISRTTPTGGRDQTFLGQLISGVGVGINPFAGR